MAPLGTRNSRVTAPSNVMRAIVPASRWAIHRASSGPTTTPFGSANSVGSGNSFVSSPTMVMRAIAFVLRSVNHMAPSGPATIGPGSVPAGSGNSVTSPA